MQLPIPFPSDLFDRVRESYRLNRIEELQRENEKLKLSIRAYKGHATKRKKS